MQWKLNSEKNRKISFIPYPQASIHHQSNYCDYLEEVTNIDMNQLAENQNQSNLVKYVMLVT